MAFYLQDFFLCTSMYTAKKSCGALSTLSEFLEYELKRENSRTSVYAKIFSLLVFGTIYITIRNFVYFGLQDFFLCTSMYTSL
mgnify:CR=1